MTDDFIHFAYAIGPGGPARELTGSDEIAAALEAVEPAWVHLQSDDPRTAEWIARHLDYLPEAVREALTAAETRPRFVRYGDGALLNLRGINMNAGADPEDMISLRAFADASRVVTLTRRPLRTIEEVRDLVVSDHGPVDAGELVADLVERLGEKVATAIGEIDVETDSLEESVIRFGGEDLRNRITDLRAIVVDYRRYVIPHRSAVRSLIESRLPILDRDDDIDLTEAADELDRAVEQLESVRERLAVLKDEVASQHADRLNRNLYVLSIVSAVFLPLSFFTGLMGINLGGMPGASWPAAFWVFSGALLALGVGLVLALAGLGFVRLTRRS